MLSLVWTTVGFGNLVRFVLFAANTKMTQKSDSFNQVIELKKFWQVQGLDFAFVNQIQLAPYMWIMGSTWSSSPFLSLWERLRMDDYVYSVLLMAPSHCLWRWQPPLSKQCLLRMQFLSTAVHWNIQLLEFFNLHSYCYSSFVTKKQKFWSSPVFWC